METYNQFITNILNTRGRVITENIYKERHHIVPRAQGGSDSEENLIDLTAKEHFIAHKLLAKENPDILCLQQAWACMAFMGKDHHEVTPEEFAECREAQAKLSKIRNTGTISPRRGIPLTEEHKEKIRTTCKLYKPTEEAKCKQSAAQMGRQVSEETRKKLSLANKGRKRSAEFRQKCSECKKGNTNAQGHKLSQESIDKVLETKRKNGTYYWSEERKQKYYETEHPRWALSEETKQKMSAANKGKEKSSTHKESLAAAQQKRFGSIEITEELKMKIILELKQGIPIHTVGKRYGISDHRIKKYIIPDMEEAQEVTE